MTTELNLVLHFLHQTVSAAFTCLLNLKTKFDDLNDPGENMTSIMNYSYILSAPLPQPYTVELQLLAKSDHILMQNIRLNVINLTAI